MKKTPSRKQAGDVNQIAASVVAHSTGEAKKTASQLPKKVKTLCICGSGRFWEEMARTRRSATLMGYIVIGPEVRADGTSLGDQDGSKAKALLDELHLRKIDMAHEVFIVDVDTRMTHSTVPYVGTSTQREIEYAVAKGKTVNRLSESTSWREAISNTHS